MPSFNTNCFHTDNSLKVASISYVYSAMQNVVEHEKAMDRIQVYRLAELIISKGSGLK